MASTKIVLLLNKSKKNDEAPLYLRIIKDRKPKYVSLGISVLPKFWDENNQCVRPKHPNSARINNFIQHKKAEATDVILCMVQESRYVKTSVLKDAIRGLSPMNFISYADNYIGSLRVKGNIGTYRRNKAILNKLKNFIGRDEFLFSDFTISFLKDYEAYLYKALNNSQNTITTNFKTLCRIFNEAVREDLVPAESNPFLKYKTKWETTEKVFLTEEELASFEALVLKSDSKKYHFRNMYVFACYAGGIRIADLLRLKWENYDGRHILLSTRKTGSVVSIMLPSKAMEILSIYHTKSSKKNDFIFPLMKPEDEFLPPDRQFNVIASLTAQANRDLRVLAFLACIEKHIHFHTSRHTWATRALRKGMRIEYVSKLMGHSSIKTTQVYAKIVNADLD
ncbi:MAG: site-specific integrase, partial [Bacteroidota bacterium]